MRFPYMAGGDTATCILAHRTPLRSPHTCHLSPTHTGQWVTRSSGPGLAPRAVLGPLAPAVLRWSRGRSWACSCRLGASWLLWEEFARVPISDHAHILGSPGMPRLPRCRRASCAHCIVCVHLCEFVMHIMPSCAMAHATMRGCEASSPWIPRVRMHCGFGGKA